MTSAVSTGVESEVIIQMRGVQKRYGEGESEVRALAGIDFDITRGDFVAIMGTSGSGKSTCMNILGCLDVPTAGSYQLAGVPTTDLHGDGLTLLRRHYIGFVFQGFNLLSRTSALENVELPLVYRRVGRQGSTRSRAALARRWSGSRIAPTTRRRSSRAASNNAWPSPAHWSPIRSCSWPTNRRATSIRRARRRS